MSQLIECSNCGDAIGRAYPALPNGSGGYNGYDPPEDEFWDEAMVVWDEEGNVFCGQDCCDEFHGGEEEEEGEGEDEEEDEDEAEEAEGTGGREKVRPSDREQRGE